MLGCRSVSLYAVAVGVVLWSAAGLGSAEAAGKVKIVALGASQTYGVGVARDEAYPAQLEAILKAKGLQAAVVNAGVPGDTTAGMLGRAASVVTPDTDIVILQPGGNDARKGVSDQREGNIEAFTGEMARRHITLIVMENQVFKGMPRGADGSHLTPDGYRKLAGKFAKKVMAALHKGA